MSKATKNGVQTNLVKGTVINARPKTTPTKSNTAEPAIPRRSIAAVLRTARITSSMNGAGRVFAPRTTSAREVSGSHRGKPSKSTSHELTTIAARNSRTRRIQTPAVIHQPSPSSRVENPYR